MITVSTTTATVVIVNDTRPSTTTTAPAGCPASPCVTITLTNQGTSTIESGSQVAIDVDWASYASVLAPNLQNVRFLDSGGAPIPAWLESCDGSESSCGTSSDVSLVWVKLDGAIAPGGSGTVFLAFAPTSVDEFSPSGDWGESPMLSPTYAEFDNGARVFNFYDDFAGTSLSGQWVNGTADNPVTVDDGLTVGPSPTDNDANAISSVDSFGAGVVDFYGVIAATGASSGDFTYGGVGLATPQSVQAGCCYFDNSALIGEATGTYGLMTGASDGLDGGAGTIVAGLTFGTNSTYSIVVPSSSPSSIAAQVDYGQTISSSVGMPTLPQPISFFDQGNTGISIGPIHWIRERAYVDPDALTQETSAF
ncbi:MAG: hypothetical protein ABSF83_07340 [Nitrososphaerales archaeon]|jgi:hypothetical protein